MTLGKTDRNWMMTWRGLKFKFFQVEKMEGIWNGRKIEEALMKMPSLDTFHDTTFDPVRYLCM